MTQARNHLISVNDTPYYHCVSRCVRKAFLCGDNGKQRFDHRRGWITEQIKTLAATLSLNVAAYAVMATTITWDYVLTVNKPYYGASKMLLLDGYKFLQPPILLTVIKSQLSQQAPN